MNYRNFAAWIFLIVVAFFMIYSMFNIHDFGSLDSIDTSMDDHIISNAQNETGANNAVTSVVFDYRGFDTLGEATVLFTAVAGVILAFRRLKK